MAIGLGEDHEALAEAVAGWAERHVTTAVVRAAVDAEEETRPPFWTDLADQGLLSVHVPEEYGGQGGGLLDLAVVLEAMGRAMVPGPQLPTALAGVALLAAGDGAKARAELLPGLADGSLIGALAMAGELTGTWTEGDALAVSGTVEPVLGAALADVVVLAVATDRGRRWVAVDAAGLTVTALPSLDRTRRCARVTAEGVRVPADRILTGLDQADVTDLAAVLLGAEAAGMAAWCVETAVAHAKVREQFGRPIGQFQGIKHKCARMLIKLEQAQAVVWDAARAAADADSAAADGDGARDGGTGDGGTGGTESRLAAAVAAVIAPDAALFCARDAIQVLGGIGFTWEHDAHLYLRRASTVRSLLGPAREWAGSVGELALAGVTRPAEVELDDDTNPLRERIRGQVGELAAIADTAERFRVMGDDGWTFPHLPAPWGRAATPLEQVLIHQEMRAAQVRGPGLGIGAWVVPSVAAYGTEEQKERFLRPTLRGEMVWCQLFSEPGAGSDLASLQMKAERVTAEPAGDGPPRSGWRLTGQKIWTSLARESEWGICLARTSAEPKKHDGITYFLVDMRAAGVDVRPLRELTGDAMFNEVFLDEVFVPDDCVVGEVGKGWQVARNTLTNERVSLSGGSGGLGAGTRELVGFFARRPAAPDPVTRAEIGALVAKGQSIDLLGLRTTLRQLSGTEPGAASSVRKLLGVEYNQDVADFVWAGQGMSAAYEDTSAESGLWARYMLFSRSMTIYGGTTEVQLNIIGERILGLPRDPEPGR